MMNCGNNSGIYRYTGILILLVLCSTIALPAAAEPLSNNRHIFINVANDAGVRFDLDGAKYGGPSNTYYIKADGGGLNELHITNDVSDAYGQVTQTSDQSGVFYITNTGGRGFDNDIVLLIAVREPVPGDFSVTIKSSGYNWTLPASGAYTPSPPTDYTYIPTAVSEKFVKKDLIYGAQNWKPGPGTLGDLSLPVYNGQDLSNTSDQFLLMFVDLKAGNMFPSKFPGASLTDNGAVKVEYSFSHLTTFAAFSGYGWCIAANQNQGISWTNPTRDFIADGGNKQSGQSGFAVFGVPASGSATGLPSEKHEQEGLPSGSKLPDNPSLYGNTGKTMSAFRAGTVNGSVRVFSDPASQPVVANNRIREANLSVDLPPGSNITFARMYLYLSGSRNIQSRYGVIPSFSATLDGKDLVPDREYFDADGDDNRFVAATIAYDVRDLLSGNGTYRVSVRNLDFEQSVFTIDTILLVTAYENGTAPATSYWIDEGCDIIKSLPEKGQFPEECDTSYSFPGTVNLSLAADADLYLVSTGLDEDNSTEHTVRFNDEQWYNILDSSDTSRVMLLPVFPFLNETYNTATIESSIRTQDADYLVNRNAILVIEQKNPDDPATTGNATTPAEAAAGETQPAPPVDANGTSLFANESGSCRITLETDPEGALIYIDDRYLGKTTPYTLDTMEGEAHRIRFELDGYEPSETTITAANSTCIHMSLYNAVHSPKGRLAEIPEDPDGSLYGGLYVNSRPSGATISIDGVSTGKTTPSVIVGLKTGSHTVSLAMGKNGPVTGNEFAYEEQNVWVQPEVLIPVDANGIGNHTLTDVIVDSHRYRGVPFTVNGYVNNRTIPAKITTTVFDSFITIHENESYISYAIPLPSVVTDSRYLLFEPRAYQSLSVDVTSSPRGAEVFIDGFRTGYTTPYRFGNLSDGPHRIMVTREGYTPQGRYIDLAFRPIPIPATPVDFDLEEFPSGFLYVDSIPEGAKITIDGMASGDVTPALFKSMPIGSHLVKVTGANSTRTFYDVTITSLEMTRLTADFTPEEE